MVKDSDPDARAIPSVDPARLISTEETGTETLTLALALALAMEEEVDGHRRPRRPPYASVPEPDPSEPDHSPTLLPRVLERREDEAFEP